MFSTDLLQLIKVFSNDKLNMQWNERETGGKFLLSSAHQGQICMQTLKLFQTTPCHLQIALKFIKYTFQTKELIGLRFFCSFSFIFDENLSHIRAIKSFYFTSTKTFLFLLSSIYSQSVSSSSSTPFSIIPIRYNWKWKPMGEYVFSLEERKDNFFM